MTSRENSWSTTCTNTHLTGLTRASLGKGSGKWEELPTSAVKRLRSARASPAKGCAICQTAPASPSCFLPSHFVKSDPHQLQGSDCTGLLSPDQHLWPCLHTTGDTILFPLSGLWLALNYICRQEPVNEGIFRGLWQKPQTQQPSKPWPQGNLHTSLLPDAYFKGFQVLKHGLLLQMKNWTSKSI